MATVNLTPEQQAALDQFEQDAEAARVAHADKLSADSTLTQATQTQAMASANDLTAHQTALASAAAFVALMVPSQGSGPGPAAQGKKVG